MTDFGNLIRQANLVAGAGTAADSGRLIDVTNPATGEVIAAVPNSSTYETRREIEAAHRAFPAFAGMPPGQRIALMRRLRRFDLDKIDRLPAILTAQQGKPQIDTAALTKIEACIADPTAKRASHVTGGATHARGGQFYRSTVLADAGHDMRCFHRRDLRPRCPGPSLRHRGRGDRGRERHRLWPCRLSPCARACPDVPPAVVAGVWPDRYQRGDDRLARGALWRLKESGPGKEDRWQGIDGYLDTKYTCIGGL